MSLTFTVTDTKLVIGDEEFEAGEHTVEKPSKDLVRAVTHAALAEPSLVSISEGGLTEKEAGWQSQEDGEKALAEAMGEHVVERNEDGTSTSYWTGPWYEGHMMQAALDAERLEGTAVGPAQAGTTLIDVEEGE